MTCSVESGGRLVCPTCKSELESARSHATVPDRQVRRRDAVPFEAAEVTVLEDGRLVMESVEHSGITAVEPAARQAGGATLEEVAVEDTVIPARTPVDTIAGESALAVEPVDRHAIDSMEEGRRSGLTRERRAWDGSPAQLLYGLVWGVIVALAIAGFWLLMAVLAKQWSQFAILTLGIGVPWATYKGTTIKKRGGVPVWKEPPGTLLISTLSFLVVAIVTVPLELLAFRVVYRSNAAGVSFSDFLSRFFTVAGWSLLILGLVLAFAVPFLLKAGEKWNLSKRKS